MSSNSNLSSSLAAECPGRVIDVISWVSVATMFVSINFGRLFPFAIALCVFIGLWFFAQNNVLSSGDKSNLSVELSLKANTIDKLVAPSNVKPIPTTIEDALTRDSLVPIPPHIRLRSKPVSDENVRPIQKTPTKATEKKQITPNLRYRYKSSQSRSEYISPNRHSTGRTRRSPPPAAAGWADAQAVIQRNDCVLQAENIATAKEMGNK